MPDGALVPLHEHGRGRRQRRQREEGQRGHDAPAVQAPEPPPAQQQEHRRQRHRAGLGGQRRGEQRQRQPPAPPAAPVQVAHPGHQRAHVADARQHVLALGQPGHRLHVHRVHHEEQGGRAGPRELQPTHQHAQQGRHQRVEQDVLDVHRERVEPEQPHVQPPGRVGQRVVLDHGPGLEPDAAQSGPALQRVAADDPVRVVPQEVAAERRRVHQQPQRGQGEEAQQVGREAGHGGPRGGGLSVWTGAAK